ncbi:hypothetical protein AAVH_41060, partial [Aphelenchoides avenae]
LALPPGAKLNGCLNGNARTAETNASGDYGDERALHADGDLGSGGGTKYGAFSAIPANSFTSSCATTGPLLDDDDDGDSGGDRPPFSPSSSAAGGDDGAAGGRRRGAATAASRAESESASHDKAKLLETSPERGLPTGALARALDRDWGSQRRRAARPRVGSGASAATLRRRTSELPGAAFHRGDSDLLARCEFLYADGGHRRDAAARGGATAAKTNGGGAAGGGVEDAISRKQR